MTIGILWLDYLRLREAERRHVAGLKLFVPIDARRWCASASHI